MRNPIRSETDAFFIAWGLALVVGLALLIGYALAPLWGIGFFTLVALLALLWDVRTEDPARRTALQQAAEGAEARSKDRRRVLVVANEALAGDDLRDELLALGEPRPQLEVVAPVLLSRSHLFVTDVDRERAEARRRLDATLAWARAQGFEAEGVVGDHVDPLAAIGDELRALGAERVIVAMHPPEREGWLEHDIVEHLRSELDVPLSRVVVGD